MSEGERASLLPGIQPTVSTDPESATTGHRTPDSQITASQTQYGSIPALDGQEVVRISQPGLWRKIFPTGYMSECRALWRLAVPVILTNMSEFMLSIVAMIFCGHLGKTQLDGVALANSMINVIGISIAIGLSSACDTLFTQIYGSPRKKRLGVALQKSLLIIPMFVLPCWAIHLNAEILLLLMGQDPATARIAGQYLLWFLPGLLAIFIQIPLSVYLQSQDIVIPSLVIGLIGNIINAVLHYVLLFVLDMGIKGSAIAQMISEYCMLVMVILYIIKFRIYEETWTGWRKECFLDWGSFYKMGVFGLIMDSLGWWAFEVGIYVTGILGTTQLGAQSVMFQLENFQYMTPLGIGISACIRVGHYLGAGCIEGAVTAARVAITVNWLCGCSLGVVYFLLRHYLPYVFTSAPEVVAMATKVIPILSIFMMVDVTASCSWVLKGSGRQTTGALISFFTYGISLSIAVPLMFRTSMGIEVLWMTLTVALFCESVITIIIIHKTDWNKQVELAAERTGANEDKSCDDDMNIQQSEQSPSLVDGINHHPDDPSHQQSHHNSLDSLTDAPTDARTTLITPPQIVLPTRTVIKRLAVLLIMVSVLIAGIFVRIYVPITIKAKELCIPWNNTAPTNTTLAYCKNATLPHLVYNFVA